MPGANIARAKRKGFPGPIGGSWNTPEFPGCKPGSSHCRYV